MLQDRVSNPGPLTYESGALPIALRSPARFKCNRVKIKFCLWSSLGGVGKYKKVNSHTVLNKANSLTISSTI